MVPAVKRDSLVSGVKFAEAGYATLLTPEELFIYDGKDLKITVNHDAILQGWREPGPRGMWRIPLQGDIDPKKSEYVSVSEEILEQVARPHLSVEAVQKHFPESEETWQGHMKGIKQSIRSTKQKKEQKSV